MSLLKEIENNEHKSSISDTKREEMMRQIKIRFLKKINDKEPWLIADIKKQLGITENLAKAKKKTLDRVVVELRKRIEYRAEYLKAPKEKTILQTTKEANQSTWGFITCIGIYLAVGFLIKFTTLFDAEVKWWSIIFLIPAMLISWLVQIYPITYIENKFTSWGMKKDKAHQVADGFWICFNTAWALVFFINW